MNSFIHTLFTATITGIHCTLQHVSQVKIVSVFIGQYFSETINSQQHVTF